MPERRQPPLRLLRLANPLLRLVLRSPLHRPLSRSLLLLTYSGRHSGRTFTIPVMFVQWDASFVALAATPEGKRWWRTFRGGAPAVVTVARRRHRVEGRLLAGEEAREALRAYLTRFPRAASRLGASACASAAELDATAERVALVAFEPAPSP
jgi:hypothetical protein